jgi:hypothetical protein
MSARLLHGLSPREQSCWVLGSLSPRAGSSTVVSIARAKELIVVGLKVTMASRHDLWAKDPRRRLSLLVTALMD